MCFSPTMEEFRDFSGFIEYMEKQGAHNYGVAKVLTLGILHNIKNVFKFFQIIPPPEWSPATSYDGVDDFLITTPISQLVTGQQGIYQLYNIQKKAIKFSEFSQMADSDQ